MLTTPTIFEGSCLSGFLHLLDKLVEDVFKRYQKNYITKTSRMDQIVTKDLSKSAVVSSH